MACGDEESSKSTRPEEWDVEDPEPVASLDHFFDEVANERATKKSSSSKEEESSSSALYNGPNTEISYGKLVDDRDDQTYRTVIIGDQVWMAENLNFDDLTSSCYKNKNTNCEKYGRLYTWSNAKYACPDGWLLPSNDAWDSLLTHVGENAAKKLKSAYDWSEGVGTDDFGFTILPAGYMSATEYAELTDYAAFWSSDYFDDDNAYSWRVTSTASDFKKGSFSSLISRSVRCIKDTSLVEISSSSEAEEIIESSSVEEIIESSSEEEESSSSEAEEIIESSSVEEESSSSVAPKSSAAAATGTSSITDKSSTSTAASSSATAKSSTSTEAVSSSTTEIVAGSASESTESLSSSTEEVSVGESSAAASTSETTSSSEKASDI